MSVSARSFLIPGVALATAGTMALTPAMTTAPIAPTALPAAAVPAIHIEEIQLAGIGREIYDSITNFVQYTVSSAQYWIDLIPVIGPPLAEQLGILYFGGIQPVVAATVYAISDVIADPLNFLTVAVDYASNLFYTGYNFISEELQFLGLPGLAPIPVPPPLASVAPAGRGAAAAVEAPAEPAPTVEAPVVEAPEAAADLTVRPDVRGRAARANAEAPRPARAAASAAEVSAEAEKSQDVSQSGQPNSGKIVRRAARADRKIDAHYPGQPRQ